MSESTLDKMPIVGNHMSRVIIIMFPSSITVTGFPQWASIAAVAGAAVIYTAIVSAYIYNIIK